MKINSTPIPNSTDSDRNLGDVFFRGEHPDKRSDKEFIELMRQRGYERIAVDPHANSMKVRCINTGEIFDSFGIAERKFHLPKGSMGYHIMCGRKFRYHKNLRFELVK